MPVCGSETLATRSTFRDLLAADAVDYVMLDLSWCGGISEARKIGTMAEAYQKPIAPHDCTGLVTIFANIHICAASTNAMILETVRGYYEGWYKPVYTENVQIENGYASFPTRPGLGTSLKPEFLADPLTSTRVTVLP